MERLPGFRDFYPEPLPHADVWSADVRQHIFSNLAPRCQRAMVSANTTGRPLEPLELFTTKSGEEIVGQLYNFTDKGERAVALRPEMTPTLARLVAAHERNYKKPIKWFAIPQLFRYERQQKGRLREHFQFNADILGEPDVAADAELIALLIDSLRALGLSADDFVIRLSSRNAWHEFYAPPPWRSRPRIRVLTRSMDKLERETPEKQRQEAGRPRLFAGRRVRPSSTPASRPPSSRRSSTIWAPAGWASSSRWITTSFAAWPITPARVFEAFDRKGEFRAIAGGGRYDNLVKLISGNRVDLPALGFGMGDVVLTELLKARGLLPTFDADLDAFCLIQDEAARRDVETHPGLAQRRLPGGLLLDTAEAGQAIQTRPGIERHAHRHPGAGTCRRPPGPDQEPPDPRGTKSHARRGAPPAGTVELRGTTALCLRDSP